MRPRYALLGAMAVVIGATLLLVPASQGDTSSPTWTCRASTAYLRFPGQARIEPVLANGNSAEPGNPDRLQCVDDDAGFPNIVLPPPGGSPPPGTIELQGPFAKTRIGQAGTDLMQPSDDLGAAREKAISADAGVVRVRIAGGPGFILTAVAEASAAGSCSGTTPTFTTSSKVVNLNLNGTPVPVDDALVPIFDGISMIGFLKIEANKEDVAADGTGKTRRALRVELLRPDNMALILEAVVGEVKVGASGAVCAPPEPPPACPPGTSEVGRQADGSVTCQQVVTQTPPCPQGTTPDQSGACVRVVVVNAPREPAPPACPAGQVRDIRGACRPEPRSRCSARRFGTPFLGTNGPDRITGTNRADRILSLGGKDKVSGGRGNDCLEGGSGNDNLDGSNGNDLMFGGTGRDIMNGGTGRDRLLGDSGNDKLTGGSGNDRLEGGAGRDKLSGGLGKDLLIGGPGRDYIEGGPGADRVIAGPGDDVINVAESGAGRDVVNCGPGRDVVRADSRDRVASNCERVLITIRRR